MKNSAKHADALKSLSKRLSKDQKPPPLLRLEPLKALVRASMSFDVSDTRADEAMRQIDKEFVDLNELRVATELEVAELLGSRYPLIEKRVELITHALNMIFEKEHTLNLDRLITLSKRDVRQFLRDLPGMHPFVEAYVMMFAFDGHAMPMDDEILNYLRDEGVFGVKTTLEEAQKFIEHQFKAEECYDFYVLVRRAAHEDANRNRRKVKA